MLLIVQYYFNCTREPTPHMFIQMLLVNISLAPGVLKWRGAKVRGSPKVGGVLYKGCPNLVLLRG